MLCKALGAVPICRCSQGVGVIARHVDVQSPVLAAHVQVLDSSFLHAEPFLELFFCKKVSR